MTEKQTEQLEALGFAVSEKDSRGNCFIGMDNPPSVEVIKKLLSVMTENDEVFYWDYYSPRLSDPGAYISILSDKDGRIIFKKANHGWSSKWSYIGIDEIAENIQKNWEKDCDGGALRNKIRVSDNIYKKEKIQQDLFSQKN